MMRSRRYDPDEARGRLLHAALLAQMQDALGYINWEPDMEAPEVPRLVTTDTGTLRAVVAS